MNFRLPDRLDIHLRELLRGTFLSFFHRIFGMALGFILSITIARILGPYGLGLFALAATSAMIASVLGRLGLDNAMLKFAAAGAAKQDWDQVAGIYRIGMAIALAASTFTSLALIALAPILAEQVFSEIALVNPIRIMALTIIPGSLLTLHGEMLKALKLTGVAGLIQGSLPPIVTLTAFGLAVAFVGGNITPSGMAWISVTSAICMLCFSLIIWRKNTPQLAGRRGDFDAACLARTSMPLFWVSSMNLIMGATDTVMLGIWSTADQVAHYGVAAQLAVLVSFPLIAVNTIAAPKIAGLHSLKDISAINKVARISVIITLTMSLPVAAIYWIWPDLPLMFYGSAYLPAVAPLMLLATGHFVNAATGPVGYLLMMTGHEKLMRNNIAGCALLNMTLNLVLIPLFGIVGAAGATAISMATMNCISLLMVYRKLGIVPLPLAPTGIPTVK